MPLPDALKQARLSGLDLVEVAPNADPPVCRIVDFGKYRYEQAKLEKERKSQAAKLKEVKFRVNIDEHDYLTKIRHAEQFLHKGNKVRVQLQFRGRENAHQEFGFVLLDRVKGDLSTMSAVEMEPRKMGRAINMVLSPLPSQRRKLRWTVPDEDLGEMEADGEPAETDQTEA